MARQIIKQPNGLLAEYSTIVDAFVFVDASEDDLIENAANEAAEEARKRYREAIERAKRGEIRKPFGLTWEEALENHNRNATPKDRIGSNDKNQAPPPMV
jgi:hypothetical protein